MKGDENEEAGTTSGGRKAFWRSASWSASRTATQDQMRECTSSEKNPGNGQFPRCPPPPLTPRTQSHKVRSCLPPLQPLAIARRSLDEWPMAGSDDLGEWPNPPTPRAKIDGQTGNSEALKLDLTLLRSQVKRDQFAFYDKECSKVADHIYLGGDYVARNREILLQHGITHVLNCVGFVCPEYFKSNFEYMTLWLQDSPTEDITSILYDVFDYFEDVRQHGGRVFVHCCQGVSRSTSLVIAYLMWREGQSFDDAFQFVKAARGIANPNMGFACQLLQCQKRVHAIPLSPNSFLRVYRMAPHSPYDPLHLVPKMLTEPTPDALDSRGAFIIHVISLIYLWIGKSCKIVMENDAKAAAFQMVRYEKVQGPIVAVKEGNEPSEFWDAFSYAPPSESGTKLSREQIESSAKVNVGERRVEAYDVDFELFYKAITGGIVPPFSSPGHGQETHLPARESSWSLLRHKFIPSTKCRFFSNTTLVRNMDPHLDGIHLLTGETFTSPPYLSPCSLSSDSSDSSKCSSQSPSVSPSTPSTPSFALSSALCNLPDNLQPSSRSLLQLSSTNKPLNPCQEEACSASKCLAPSIAERRGKFSPLKLPVLVKDSSFLLQKVVNSSSNNSKSLQGSFDKSHKYDVPSVAALGHANNVGVVSEAKCLGAKTNISENSMNYQEYRLNQGGLTFLGDPRLVHERSETSISSPGQTLVYRWPDMEKLATVAVEDLDSKSVFLVLTPNTTKSCGTDKILYLWIGSDFDKTYWQNLNCNRDERIVSIDWHQVCCNFLDSVGLPTDLPIKVVKEHEAKNLQELLVTC